MNVRDVLPQVENKWEIEIGLESLPLSQRAIFPFGKTKPPRPYRLESDPNPKFRIICSSNLEIVTNAVVVAPCRGRELTFYSYSQIFRKISYHQLCLHALMTTPVIILRLHMVQLITLQTQRHLPLQFHHKFFILSTKYKINDRVLFWILYRFYQCWSCYHLFKYWIRNGTTT